MLYALRHPAALGYLFVGFVVAVSIHALVRGVVARATGQLGALSRPVGARDPRHQVDPFGLVALVLAGACWMRPLEPPGRWRSARVRRITMALSGALSNLVLGAAAFVGFRALGGSGVLAAAVGIRSEVEGSLVGTAAQQALLALAAANLSLGLLELVPIPPLEGADVLFSLVRPTPGWQKVRYHLAERNWGVAIVLLLLLLPIAGNAPPLFVLIDLVGRAIMHGLSGFAV
ncbi:MAG: hypothetical protein ACYCO3_09115 [Mycobacteriales bacterium]